MSWNTSGCSSHGSFVIGVVMSAPPVPTCNDCGKPSTLQTRADLKHWCGPCLLAHDAPQLFRTLFDGVDPSQRSRLYRALAAVLHPDSGGDERVMKALNAVKEQFP